MQPNVFAYICATVRCFADAEDVLQNVAMTAIRKFSGYDAAKPFDAWIIGIARVEILRHLRAQARDRHELVDDQLLELLAGAHERILPDMNAQRSALAHCRKKLTGRMRDVIERRYGQEMKTASIAEATGLSVAYVSVALNRAYRRLRECIGRTLKEGAA